MSAAVTDAERKLAFRRAAGAFPTGVCVVATEHEGRPAGMTLNSFVSVSLEPLLVLVSLAHGSRTLDAVRRSGRYAVSVLRRGQRAVAIDFADRRDAFPEMHVQRAGNGFPVVRHALAYLRCEVEELVTVGDHDLAIGRVLAFEAESGEPLVFHQGQFGGVAVDEKAPEQFGLFLEEGIGW